jgi:hypothetical protein
LQKRDLRHLIEGDRRVVPLVVADLVVAGLEDLLEGLDVVDDEELVLRLRPQRILHLPTDDEVDDVALQVVPVRQLGDAILVERLKDLDLGAIRDEHEGGNPIQEVGVGDCLFLDGRIEDLIRGLRLAEDQGAFLCGEE